MTIRGLKSEIRRLTSRIGADEEPITMVTIAVVDASAGASSMDFPDIVGHSLSYRILGQYETFFFPFTDMTSEQAEAIAHAIILHTRQVERLGRLFPAGIFDMTLEQAGSRRISLPPPGTTTAEYAAEIYRQVIESRTAPLPHSEDRP
ncbi:hypothetical protein [Pseudomonas plecoglossicida]|uniref:hypothetical protein n=1 Tax=Pseudomonas plecoglossicida TaxID=70775 RepID=UPI00051DE6B1|nr:hypothetical protein [Pseudomonas plecoglossicida]KGK23619.1 hypothetical protein GT93_01750 [Pseudomonas plecoglossicida]